MRFRSRTTTGSRPTPQQQFPLQPHRAGHGRQQAAGEWQTYEITLIGRDLTVVLNGKKVIDKELSRTDRHGHDPTRRAGSLSLQGDHGAVEFRISITRC